MPTSRIGLPALLLMSSGVGALNTTSTRSDGVSTSISQSLLTTSSHSTTIASSSVSSQLPTISSISTSSSVPLAVFINQGLGSTTTASDQSINSSSTTSTKTKSNSSSASKSSTVEHTASNSTVISFDPTSSINSSPSSTRSQSTSKSTAKIATATGDDLDDDQFVLDTKDYGTVTGTATVFTVAATGIGHSYAKACNEELNRYISLTQAQYGTAYANTTYQPWTAYTAEVTTACDGHPRVVGVPRSVSAGISKILNNAWTPYAGPTPSCSIQSSDCSWLSSSSTSFTAAQTEIYPDPPACTYTPAINDPQCGPCTMVGGRVELLYFPVPTAKASRDMCALTPGGKTVCPYGKTIESLTTGTNFYTDQPCSYLPMNATMTVDSGPSLVTAGQTYYENRAYISYATIYATNSCGRVGSGRAGGVVTLASSDVYSLSGYHLDLLQDAYTFNFADLNPTVPASAWAADPACQRGQASYNLGGGTTMTNRDLFNGKHISGLCEYYIDSAYAPTLALPPQLRQLDPKWSTCLLGLQGLQDPPSALAQAAVVASATLPGAASEATSASPASTPSSPASVTTTPTALPQTISASASSTVSAATAGATSIVQTSAQALSSTAKSEDPVTISSAQLNTSNPTVLSTASATVPNNSDSIETSSNIATSAASSGNAVIGTQTVSQTTTHSTTLASTTTVSQAVVSIGSGSAATTVTAVAGTDSASRSIVVVGSSTISIGGAAATVSGTAISAATGGIVIGSQTVSLVATTATLILSSASVAQAAVTIGSGSSAIALTATAVSGTGSSAVVAIGSTTLIAGGAAATISGAIVSAASNGIVVNGQSTVSLSAPEDAVTVSLAKPAATADVTLTLGGQAVTVSAISLAGATSESASAVVVDSSTLTVGGGAFTIGGSVVSAVSGGVVVNGIQTVQYSRTSTSSRSTKTSASSYLSAPSFALSSSTSSSKTTTQPAYSTSSKSSSSATASKTLAPNTGDAGQMRNIAQKLMGVLAVVAAMFALV